jgi:hypothetical protein
MNSAAIIDKFSETKNAAYGEVKELISSQQEKSVRRNVAGKVLQADVSTATTAYHDVLNEDDSYNGVERAVTKAVSTPFNVLFGMFKGWN